MARAVLQVGGVNDGRAQSNFTELYTGVGTQVTLTYGTTIATDASLGKEFIVTITDGTGFTVSNPTNLVTGQQITYTFRNTSGGAAGTLTFGNVFKAATWTQAATANSRSVTFQYNGTNLIEISRTASDIPN